MLRFDMTKITRFAKLATGSLLASALLWGCQVGRGDSEIEDQFVSDAGSSDALGAADTDWSDDAGVGQGAGAGTMSGTWLLYHERSTCLLGQEQLTHATYLIEITQEGSTLLETRQLCDTRLSEVLGMQIHIPERVLESIDFIEQDQGLVSSLRLGGSYLSSTEIALWGLELENPTTGSLPESADDPQVVDKDQDGHPAVTFMVGDDCERYQSQRQLMRYHGTFTTPNQIDGQSAGITDMVVYGGSNSFCTIAPPVEPNDKASRFRMVRVDGKGGSIKADSNRDGTVSCQEAIALSPYIMPTRDSDSSRCK